MTNDYGTGLLGHYAAYPSRLQNSVQNLGIEVGRVALLPRGPLSNLNPIGCGALQMPVGGKNPEGGWHFTDFIGNDPENDSIWCTAFGQIPPRFSFRDSIVYTAYRNAIPGTEPFIEGQKNSYAHYFGPGTAEIWTQFAKIQEAVILAGARHSGDSGPIQFRSPGHPGPGLGDRRTDQLESVPGTSWGLPLTRMTA